MLHLAIDPPELAKGRYAAPAWLILAAGGAVIVFAVVYLVLRFRRTDKQGDMAGREVGAFHRSPPIDEDKR